MAVKAGYTYIDPSRSAYLEDKLRRYEKHIKDLEHRLEADEKLLSSHRLFLSDMGLVDTYTAWQVAKRLEE